MVNIGYTTGVFDLFHIGHLNLLKRAKLQCEQLIVAVATDELCFARKGKTPVIPFSERFEIVKSIKYVDKAIVQNCSNKIDAWHNIGFHKIFVGSDWKGTIEWNEYDNRFAKLNVEVIYLPYTETTSSTILRQSLLHDDLFEPVFQNHSKE